ncbi:MAG: DUF72 domain-containing protein [Pseudomonadota bacterium]
MQKDNLYFLGLPAWGFPAWSRRFFNDTPSRLANYAHVFNTVEGNTTFYRIPDEPTVARWKEAVSSRPFRFCFKLPREVTHERFPDLHSLEKFLHVIEPLEDHLAPLLVQLPATVGPDDLFKFEQVFGLVSERYRFAIEVRHLDFFHEPELLDKIYDDYGGGRVMLDSRPLYFGDRNHPEVTKALHVKPDVPVVAESRNRIALIRLILHPDLISNGPYMEEWATHVSEFLRDEVETYMMIHCPNNLHCPTLALEFHNLLREKTSLDPLPPWPIPAEQHSLF